METKNNCDFSGYATRNDLECGDGRVIRRDAFKHNSGVTVPLVWNHEHTQDAILGHALLENRDDGVYAYGFFNDTEQGQHAKKLVQNGDISSLSIWATRLKQMGKDVIHGDIKELSLVPAGANPGAFVDFVMAHGEDAEDYFIASYDQSIMLYHSADPEKKDDKKPEDKTEGEETVKDVYDSMTEKQKTVVHALVGAAIAEVNGENNSEGKTDDMKHSEIFIGGESMKYNVFDNSTAVNKENYLSHSAQEEIINLAKMSSVGSLRTAMEIYAEEHDDVLVHGFQDYAVLFPEYELTKKGAPELLERDQSWVSGVISKIHKSPISRIRTRQADARIAELRAKGYQNKGDEKKVTAKIKMLGRQIDPQTVYIKDEMHRDDIIDITDFDVVSYNWNIMQHTMYEELALAALIGDGRDEADPDKIHEAHIQPIWTDDDLYTIHKDVDIAAERTELQGTNTNANFSENYIYAEAIIKAALYAREQYKGSGNLDFYCTPHLLNVMLLSRDLNGRRIYDSKNDLAAALNVNSIVTVEQFEGKTRETEDHKTKKLLGLFVNLGDYTFGSTKGGELAKFDQFDIDFNKYKYLLETRVSGALTRVYSAIALEEPVNAQPAG